MFILILTDLRQDFKTRTGLVQSDVHLPTIGYTSHWL